MEREDIILVVERKHLNPQYRTGEEILTRIILNKSGLKYKIIEHYSDKNTIKFPLTTDFPFLYINKSLIPPRNLPIFLKSFIYDETQNIEFNEIIYYSRDLLRNLNQRTNQILSNSKNLLEQLITNSVTSCIAYDERGNKTETHAITRVVETIFIKLLSLIENFLNDYNKIVLYAFLKDSIMINYLFPKDDKELKEKYYKAISEYINSVDDLIIRNKSFVIIANKEIKTEEFSIQLKKKDFSNKEKKANDIQSENFFWHNVFSLGMFFSLGLTVWLFSRKKEKIKTN